MWFHSIETNICIILKILKRMWLQRPLASYAGKKLYKCYPLNYIYCTQNFVRFHAVKSKIELPQEFWEKKNSRAPYWARYTQIASLLFLMIYILCINFCSFSLIRNRDQCIPKISEKVELQRHLLSNFHQKLIDTNTFR